MPPTPAIPPHRDESLVRDGGDACAGGGRDARVRGCGDAVVRDVRDGAGADVSEGGGAVVPERGDAVVRDRGDAVVRDRDAPVPDRGDALVRDRGDACPGALRLHEAADGFLARLRLPAGLLTPSQALALADAADRLGDGHLSLTSRGNAELRGLAADSAAPLADLLRTAGLLPSDQHERVRNIVASPLAGLDGQGADGGAAVQDWARELDRLLCASATAPALSGRFLFALDDGRGDVAALGADVTLIAEAGGTALLRIGDDVEALRLPGCDAPRVALNAAEAFLAVAREAGNGAWRVRELPPGYGAATVRVHLRTQLAESCATAAPPAPTRPAPPRPGLVTTPDGTSATALSLLAPLGRLTSAHLRELAAIAARDGAGELRMTPWRGVVLPGLSAETAGTRLRDLAATGLVTDPASPWYGLGACTGRPGCAKSLADVRADAVAAVAAVTTGTAVPTAGGTDPLPVHWSGCARRCGHPHGAWVDVVATGDAYEVSVRGTRDGANAVTAVPAAEPGRLADAVATARAATRTPPAT
ncbi:precorrin-3B synthase [Streptomyces albofaciens]|uniref:precorrin-3B synthase n=1 Tax=Streptomyces albofaciens TaxID=66866 RepID=UPI001FCC68A5|nr:precorrin-3B synthase [Streptomyces albofaciens]